MARRLEVELTSSRPDGTWTWRAAGAREPRGVVAAELLGADPHVGDVLRVEADVDLDGITILAVLPARPERTEPDRLELRGSGREAPPITTVLAGRSRRSRADRRGPDSARGGGPRVDGTGRPSRTPASASGRRPGGGTSPDGRFSGARRSAADRGASRETTAGRPARPGAVRPESPEAAAITGAPRTPSRGRRIHVRSVHRDQVVLGLPPEQVPIAQQLLRGGLPAVRQAIDEQNAEAAAAGLPPVPAEPLLRLAEELLPRLKAAAWWDRAEAIAAALDSAPLRDLRAIVSSSDQARSEEARALAAQLKEALDARVAHGRTQWADEIAQLLDGEKVARALRLAARPPDPLARLSAELAVRLAAAASAALSPTTPPAHWEAILEAAAASPVRQSIRPVGLPEGADPALATRARQHAGLVPGIARLLGMSVPPPPPRPMPGAPQPPAPGGGAARSRGPRRPPRDRAPVSRTATESVVAAPDDSPVPTSTETGPARTGSEEPGSDGAAGSPAEPSPLGSTTDADVAGEPASPEGPRAVGPRAVGWSEPAANEGRVTGIESVPPAEGSRPGTPDATSEESEKPEKPESGPLADGSASQADDLATSAARVVEGA